MWVLPKHKFPPQFNLLLFRKPQKPPISRCRSSPRFSSDHRITRKHSCIYWRWMIEGLKAFSSGIILSIMAAIVTCYNLYLAADITASDLHLHNLVQSSRIWASWNSGFWFLVAFLVHLQDFFLIWVPSHWISIDIEQWVKTVGSGSPRSKLEPAQDIGEGEGRGGTPRKGHTGGGHVWHRP